MVRGRGRSDRVSLVIQSIPRLLIEVSQVHQKVAIVLRSLATLTPEYVAVAIPFAMYLCTATAFRQLALRSELEALAGCGLSDWRLLRQPMILAVASCLVVLTICGFVEPANERQLDAIGQAVNQGEFGFGLQPGIRHELSASTRLFFARVGRPGNVLVNVAVESDKFTAIANSASLDYSRNGQWKIMLENGNIFWRTKGADQAFQFRRLGLSEPFRPPSLRLTSVTDRLDRLNLWQLLSFEHGGPGLTARAARSAASARIAAALLCLLMPLFGSFRAFRQSALTPL